MIVKLLTEHHLEFLSLTGGCRGPSESTLVKMSNCWKSHAIIYSISGIVLLIRSHRQLPICTESSGLIGLMIDEPAIRTTVPTWNIIYYEYVIYISSKGIL